MCLERDDNLAKDSHSKIVLAIVGIVVVLALITLINFQQPYETKVGLVSGVESTGEIKVKGCTAKYEIGSGNEPPVCIDKGEFEVYTFLASISDEVGSAGCGHSCIKRLKKETCKKLFEHYGGEDMLIYKLMERCGELCANHQGPDGENTKEKCPVGFARTPDKQPDPYCRNFVDELTGRVKGVDVVCKRFVLCACRTAADARTIQERIIQK